MATFTVGDFSQDILGFDPANDQLDFSDISVHSLIIGQDEDGFATIVFPWQPDQYQRILDVDGQGIRWEELSERNFAPVGNEHLRQDVGGVMSWESKIGPAFDPGNESVGNTVYIRSHEKNSVTTVDGFDPRLDKINFLYFGTRERLTVENVGSDLVISSEPLGQKFIFSDVQKEDLIGANLEFHFDQIEEDLLDRAFGFSPEQLALVDRTSLFTPDGGLTDGSQTRPGEFVTAFGEAPGQPTTLDESNRLIQERADQDQSTALIESMPMTAESQQSSDGMDSMPMDMDMVSPDLSNVVMNLPGGANPHNSCLQLDVNGSLWWGGGISGDLIIRNPMGVAVEDWEVSFLTSHSQFESWSGDVQVSDAGNGLNRVTFNPADWNGTIPANGEISISFNAQGEGLPDSGALTSSDFFTGAAVSAAPVDTSTSLPSPAPALSSDLEAVEEQALASSGPSLQPGDPAEIADALMTGGDADPSADPSLLNDIAEAATVQADSSGNPLSLEVSGNLYWGGMSGILTITNTSERAIDNWSVSFETPHSDFQSWAGGADIDVLPDGGSQVTLTPASWNSEIAAGQSIDVSFNAVSEGLPNSGELTSDLFFRAENVSRSATIVANETSGEVLPIGGTAETQEVPEADANATITSEFLSADPDEISANLQVADQLDYSNSLNTVAKEASAELLLNGGSADAAERSQTDVAVTSRSDLLSAGSGEISANLQVADQVDSSNSLSPSSQEINSPEKKVVAYFEEWGIYERDFLVQDINVEQLTHINYSFFDVKANGDVNLFDPWAAEDKRFTADEQVNRTFSAAEWQDLDLERRNAYVDGGEFTSITNSDGSVTVTGVPVGWSMPVEYVGNLRQFDLVKQLYPDINLGFALGGWTLSDEFSLAVDSASGRDGFTDNVVDIFKQYDFFNTVDFDWEYPGGGGDSGNASSSEDGANFALTLELLKGKLDELEQSTGENYEVSIATAGGADKLANLNLPGIDPYVDFYNVMTYDFHGGWESVTGHQAAMVNDPGGYDIATAIEQFEVNGVDLNKVVLGAPAYTRAWGNVQAGDTFGLGNSGDARQAPGSYESGNYDQKDLITGVTDGRYELIWDDDSKAAFVYNEDTQVWSSIETPATIAGKTAYVDEMGLGGMMFWALSNDSSGDQSLIASASDLLLGGASFDEVISRSEPFDSVIGGDGHFGLDDFVESPTVASSQGVISADPDLFSAGSPASQPIPPGQEFDNPLNADAFSTVVDSSQMF